MLWASHVVHHSSEYYNLSRALRQPWTPFSSLPYWLPLAILGFAPWMIVIVWDRLFGTFEPEGERVVYGLTTNIKTFNPVRVATHEFAAIWRDVRRVPSLRDRAGYLLRGPGWSPS